MRSRILQLVVGILISGFFIWIALRPVQMSDLRDAFIEFNWLWSFPFLVITFVSFYLRAIRWHYLLLPEANLSSRRLFSPLMIGFALNSILPARAGEFARAGVLMARDRLKFAPVFATVVVERLFDSVILLFLLGGTFAFIQFDDSIKHTYSTVTDWRSSDVAVACFVLGAVLLGGGMAAIVFARRLRAAARGVRIALRIAAPLLLLLGVGSAVYGLLIPVGYEGSWFKSGRVYEISAATLKALSRNIAIGCALLVAGIATLVWPVTRNMVLKAVHALKFLPEGVREFVVRVIESFSRGLSSVRDVRSLAIVVVLSFAVWVTTAWSMQVLTYGFEGMRMTLTQALAVTVITCIAILIPAAPGYWGLMEVGIVFGLLILGIEANAARALSYALILHGLQYFPIVIVGLAYLYKEDLRWKDLIRPPA